MDLAGPMANITTGDVGAVSLLVSPPPPPLPGTGTPPGPSDAVLGVPLVGAGNTTESPSIGLSRLSSPSPPSPPPPPYAPPGLADSSATGLVGGKSSLSNPLSQTKAGSTLASTVPSSNGADGSPPGPQSGGTSSTPLQAPEAKKLIIVAASGLPGILCPLLCLSGFNSPLFPLVPLRSQTWLTHPLHKWMCRTATSGTAILFLYFLCCPLKLTSTVVACPLSF